MLIFGGELNDFARRLIYVVLVAGILLDATQIVALFGSSGASIGDVAPIADRAADIDHGCSVRPVARRMRVIRKRQPVASSAPPDLSGAAASAIAGDMVTKFAELVGPGPGTIILKPDGSPFGQALETSLKSRG